MVDGINRTKMHTYNTATGQLVSTALGTPGTSNCPLYNQSCHPNWYFYEFAQEFDQSGNVKASYEVDTDVNSQEAVPTETRHYYDAAERLTYSNTMRGFIWWAGTGFGTFTDYRYDALGRRVLSRTRRVESTCAVPCDAFIERTVYDGDQVLAEIRSSGQIGASASVLKADGVPAQNGQTSGWTDPRYPHLFGIVLYAHGLGIDAPVHVLKRHPNGSWAGFTPLEDWRGSYWGGRRTNGSACDSTCPAEWPSGAVNAFGRELGIEPATYTTWHGSLIRGRKDANGLTYLRNRYYDPTTGQFTQPDPIGLAGGLNAYGFAAGDPVNYSDPFGLCPEFPALCPLLRAFFSREARRLTLNDPRRATVVQGEYQSRLHRLGGETGNVKRTSPDGLHESVQDENGNEVKGQNAATYNFRSASELYGLPHLVSDVVPWIVVGTLSPGDDSTIGSRLKSAIKAALK